MDIEWFSPGTVLAATPSDVLRLIDDVWQPLGPLPYEDFIVSQLEGTSDNDLWILGIDRSNQRQVAHWDGSVWSKVNMRAEPLDLAIAGDAIAVLFRQIDGVGARIFHRIYSQ